MLSKDKFYELECVRCGTRYDETQTYTSCLKCGGPLDVKYDYQYIGERLNTHVLKTAPIRALKYLDFYPLLDLRKVVTLDEGGTPLYRCKKLGERLGLKRLYVKFEGANPTGAFKDRGSVVELTKALELESTSVCVASTGNMAASVSAYSAKAGLPCYVLVPEGTPIGKLSQTLSYGARVIQIRGTYDDAARLTVKLSNKHNFYLAGDYAFRLEGQKSEAYEIIEQLDWHSPDKVFVPIGCGTNLSAIWKGFKEYKLFDLIDDTPSMIGVQAEGCAPVVKALASRSKTIIPVEKPQTVASAIAAGTPLDGLKVLSAIKESKGDVKSVSDAKILEAQRLLAREESIFVEPSAAASLALLEDMVKAGKVSKDEVIVLVMTGAGLKDPKAALSVLPSPPSVEPDLGEVDKFLDYGYYKVVTEKKKRVKPLFKSVPSVSSLRSSVKKVFDVKLNERDLKIAHEHVKGFLRKGKTVRESDMRFILKDILGSAGVKKKILEIVDFNVTSTKNDKPKAVVRVKYKGKIQEVDAKGVGPVDAAINAIKKAVSNGFVFRLTDYLVEIDTENTDAAVSVKMTLVNDRGDKVIAIGTSPDIIVASLLAFEDGYNLLHHKGVKK
jgi:threonine synthase